MQVPLEIFSDSQALIVGKPTPTGFMPGTKLWELACQR